ncbi:hypothetical protein L21SP2_2752 [Salinispira pacifica]|uniref:Uncharacterized protein n=1 Tax=Salinispira pacifica TaxID=1307761 RepID=V5WJX6_9SPIO|nr:hypothetical protein L21SP2_2752 [Salinispira pacifica]
MTQGCCVKSRSLKILSNAANLFIPVKTSEGQNTDDGNYFYTSV